MLVQFLGLDITLLLLLYYYYIIIILLSFVVHYNRLPTLLLLDVILSQILLIRLLPVRVSLC